LASTFLAVRTWHRCTFKPPQLEFPAELPPGSGRFLVTALETAHPHAENDAVDIHILDALMGEILHGHLSTDSVSSLLALLISVREIDLPKPFERGQYYPRIMSSK
jgi:hypothetical protein